jgi:endonuclease/exonuclease/phosphatase family metal-dependent hydrolase
VVRLLSYNIHGCIGRDGRKAPDRILEVIEQTQADVVALQEVYRTDGSDQDFLKQLESLEYPVVIYGKTMRKASADYGNLLLLRQPAEKIERLAFEGVFDEPRGAIVAEILHRGKRLRVINTHLGLRSAYRKAQIAALAKHLPQPGSTERCILLGDLNEWLPRIGYFRRLRRRFSVVSSLKTFPAGRPVFALDRIAVGGAFQDLRFHVASSHPATLASDHRPLICDVEF